MSSNTNTISPHHLIKTKSYSTTTHIFICDSSALPEPVLQLRCDNVEVRTYKVFSLRLPQPDPLTERVSDAVSITHPHFFFISILNQFSCARVCRVTLQLSVYCNLYLLEQFCRSWPFQWILLELIEIEAA